MTRSGTGDRNCTRASQLWGWSGVRVEEKRTACCCRRIIEHGEVRDCGVKVKHNLYVDIEYMIYGEIDEKE